MGDPIELPADHDPKGFWSYYAVHSYKDGVLDEVKVRDDVKPMIIENHLIKHPGDHIEAFRGANSTLGCFVMKFNSMDQMLHMMDHSEDWINAKNRK